MPRLLNAQHEFFCRAYVNSPFAGNLADAYEAAGYARDRGNAVRLSRQPDVAARIAELREADRAVERQTVREALIEEGIDRASLVRIYGAMMRANPLDYYTVEPNGVAKPYLDRLDVRKGMAVREIDIGTRPAVGRMAEVRLKLRFYDKHKAMAQLAKLIEFSEEMAEPAPAEELSEEQQRARMVASLRDYAEQADEAAVMALAAEAVAAAKARYPDRNITNFERISRDVERQKQARAERAAIATAMEAKIAAFDAKFPPCTQAQAAMDALEAAKNHDSNSCHDGPETAAEILARIAEHERREARLESVAGLEPVAGVEPTGPRAARPDDRLRETRENNNGLSPGDASPENHDSKSCHPAPETSEDMATSAPDFVALNPGYDAVPGSASTDTADPAKIPDSKSCHAPHAATVSPEKGRASTVKSGHKRVTAPIARKPARPSLEPADSPA